MKTLNTPRFDDRIITLDSCFSKSNMKEAWKTVREGMRKQTLLDLHDYYDFHKNQDSLIEIIRSKIIKGYYQPKSPQTIRLEKNTEFADIFKFLVRKML